MPFCVGFPVCAVKYFSKFKFCIHDCHFWVRFPVSAVFGILHLRLPFFRSNSGDHRPPLTRLDPAEGAEAPADSDYLSVSYRVA